MKPVMIATIAVLAAAGGVSAQEDASEKVLETEVVQTPLFQARTEFTLPSETNLTGSDSFGLDFTVSPEGQISNVKLSPLAGSSRGNYCEPMCWQEGNPPQTFCIVMAGCPGAGGGGGGILSTRPTPLVLEFNPLQGAEGELAYEFRVEEIAPARPSVTKELRVPLPETGTTE